MSHSPTLVFLPVTSLQCIHTVHYQNSTTKVPHNLPDLLIGNKGVLLAAAHACLISNLASSCDSVPSSYPSISTLLGPAGTLSRFLIRHVDSSSRMIIHLLLSITIPFSQSVLDLTFHRLRDQIHVTRFFLQQASKDSSSPPASPP